MPEKVLFSLVGNSLMHRGVVSEIKFSVEEKEEFYRLIHSDSNKKNS